MQTEKQKHIEQLLERFFDGQTSNAEEQELYSFFNSSDVPEALKSYQPVFGYFETGIREELNEKEAKDVIPPGPIWNGYYRNWNTPSRR